MGNEEASSKSAPFLMGKVGKYRQAGLALLTLIKLEKP
jgi:hypothetical protein